MVPPSDPTPVEIVADIVGATAELLDVPSAAIRGRRRPAKIVRARFVVYWLGWWSGISYSELGRILDRDHSTILSGVRRMNQELRIDAELVDLVRAIALEAGITT